MRILKDGWPIHKEWVQYERYEEVVVDGKLVGVKGVGKRSHWVITECSSCGQAIQMPLSKLVKDGSEQCDGCMAYNDRYR